MNYNKVQFRMSAGIASQLPPFDRPEIAFVGRSNVGKSSLLNKLFNRKSLVKVSSKPGKTTTINFFDCEGVDFVDLPGYGYARVAASEQERWMKLMEGYFESERNLKLVVALVDIRHDASPLDEQMIDYLLKLEWPFMIAFTKCDKLSRQKGMQMAAKLKRSFTLPSGVEAVLTSSSDGTGIDELKGIIERALKA